MVEYSQGELIIGAVFLFVSTLSIIASLLTLYVIHKTPKWTGFLLLIYSMTICQLLYDISFYFLLDYSSLVAEAVIDFLTSFGGISVTLWTNVLSGIVYYIVILHGKLIVKDHYWKFFCISIVPSVVFAVLAVVGGDSSIFYLTNNVIRIVSSFVNVIVYLLISRSLRQVRGASPETYGALVELSARLKYYPICQAITRIPAYYYQFAYQQNSSIYVVNTSDVPQTIALVLYSIFLPSAGIGYFLIFIYMQPHAWSKLKDMTLFRCLKRWLFCLCCCHLCCSASTTAAPLSEDSKSRIFGQASNLPILSVASNGDLNNPLRDSFTQMVDLRSTLGGTSRTNLSQDTALTSDPLRFNMMNEDELEEYLESTNSKL